MYRSFQRSLASYRRIDASANESLALLGNRRAMAPASARSDALALGLSLGAAATSAYVLWKTTQEPKQTPTDKKLEKKLKQQARSRKIESLIMERGQAGARAAPKVTS